jgi:hypothetical protein
MASDNSPATKSTKDGRSSVQRRTVRHYTTDYSGREREGRKERLSYTRRTVHRYTMDDKEREIFKTAGKATLHDERLGLYDFPPLLGVRFTFNVLNEGHILC